MSPSRAEIVVDLAAIRHNVGLLRDLVAPARLMVVVKADGYGHGLHEVAHTARAAGAEWLGVATLDEALALRAGGDEGPLLCWLGVPGEDYAAAAEADVEVTAYTRAELDEMAAVGGLRVQLKADTGLSRGGATAAQWPALVDHAASLERAGRLRVSGIWSHLACADEPDSPVNDAQQAAFEDALARADAAGLRPGVRHLANSAAALLRPAARYDLVRCGIAAYGLDPAPGRTPDLGLRPAMSVRATLALAKPVAAGAGVSYGHAWTAPGPTTLGLVPVGYADGVPRAAGGVVEVLLDGRRRRVVGRVCMDQVVVDLGGDLPAPGSDVVLFGPGDDGEPTALEWADALGTITYEIVTRMGGRLVRRHVDGAAVGATDPDPVQED